MHFVGVVGAHPNKMGWWHWSLRHWSERQRNGKFDRCVATCPSSLIYKSGLNFINYGFFFSSFVFLSLSVILSHSVSFPLCICYICKYCFHQRCSLNFGPNDRPQWYIWCIYMSDVSDCSSPFSIFPLSIQFPLFLLIFQANSTIALYEPAPAESFPLLKKDFLITTCVCLGSDSCEKHHRTI